MGAGFSMRMIRRIAIALLTAGLLACGGCSVMDKWLSAERDDVIEHGTTAGNIVNYGFAVQYGEDILALYTGDTAYPKGSLVRVNPNTGESSLVLERSGLYMNIEDDSLYYCLPDGIYKTPVDAPEPQRIISGEVSLLQITGSRLYYAVDGGIGCAEMDGTLAVDFTRVENADGLIVYGEALYYIDTKTGQVCKADLTGGSIETAYDHSVRMFMIVDDIIYFIESADGFIKRIALGDDADAETVVAYPCSGFNINRYGIYYTREVDGRSLCCNAGPDGAQESVLTDLGESARHAVCLWNDTAQIAKTEDILAAD